MENKVVVITGASSGIGRTTAHFLSEKGYKVYGISRRLVEDNFISISCDVTDSQALAHAFEHIYLLENRIDCLINNAGMGISGTIEDISSESSRKLFDINVNAVMDGCHLAIPYLKKTKGIIINTSSVAAVIPIPFQTAYSASKAAINSFTLALRSELKPLGIRVCAVMPGDTRTGFTDARDKTDATADYNDRVKKSVERMEKDERGGKDPITVSKVIYKLLTSKNPAPLKAVGFEYKLVCFLSKVLPVRLMMVIVDKLYG